MAGPGSTGEVAVIAALIFAGFLAVVSGFAVWRSVKVWRQDEAYLLRTSAWMVVFPVAPDFRRGLARGRAPFAVGLAALTVAMILFIAGGAASPHMARPIPGARPPWPILVGLPFLAAFLAGEVLLLSVAWFNRPRWCVPPFLRDEPGVWRSRREDKVAGRNAGHKEKAFPVKTDVRGVDVLTRFELEPGERILRRSVASEWRGAIVYGGKLLLTDRRLIFRPHLLNLDRKVTSSQVASIRRVEPVGSNRIAVSFKNGAMREFIVFRRKVWIERILQASGRRV